MISTNTIKFLCLANEEGLKSVKKEVSEDKDSKSDAVQNINGTMSSEEPNNAIINENMRVLYIQLSFLDIRLVQYTTCLLLLALAYPNELCGRDFVENFTKKLRTLFRNENTAQLL